MPTIPLVATRRTKADSTRGRTCMRRSRKGTAGASRAVGSERASCSVGPPSRSGDPSRRGCSSMTSTLSHRAETQSATRASASARYSSTAWPRAPVDGVHVALPHHRPRPVDRLQGCRQTTRHLTRRQRGPVRRRDSSERSTWPATRIDPLRARRIKPRLRAVKRRRPRRLEHDRGNTAATFGTPANLRLSCRSHARGRHWHPDGRAFRRGNARSPWKARPPSVDSRLLETATGGGPRMLSPCS
jgi:hypothetical protein